MKLCLMGSPPVLGLRTSRASLRSCSLGNFHSSSYFSLVCTSQVSVRQTKLLEQEQQLVGIEISLHRGAGLKDTHFSRYWKQQGLVHERGQGSTLGRKDGHWLLFVSLSALEGVSEGRCDLICFCLHQEL